MSEEQTNRRRGLTPAEFLTPERMTRYATRKPGMEAGRIAMARDIAEAVAEVAPCRATTEIILDPLGERDRLQVKLCSRLSGWVDIERRPQKRSSGELIYFIHWFVETREEGLQIAPGFAPEDRINSCHRHKATDVCVGFANLVSTLTYRVAKIEDGTALVAGTPKERLLVGQLPGGNADESLTAPAPEATLPAANAD